MGKRQMANGNAMTKRNPAKQTGLGLLAKLRCAVCTVPFNLIEYNLI